MKIKVYVIDMEIPARIKRWALGIGIPAAMVLGGGAIAYAAGLVTWTSGETLQAADLNNNFSYLQSEISGDGGVQPQITALQAQITTTAFAPRAPSAFRAELTTAVNIPNTTLTTVAPSISPLAAVSSVSVPRLQFG